MIMIGTPSGMRPRAALLRVARWAMRWTESDETTSAAQHRAAARYAAVADAPIPKEARLRAEREMRTGTRQVVHLRRLG
ncbi:MAG: hypothetical protein ACRDRJ_12135 [Streptosporangiaceae bacterium]